MQELFCVVTTEYMYEEPQGYWDPVDHREVYKTVYNKARPYFVRFNNSDGQICRDSIAFPVIEKRIITFNGKQICVMPTERENCVTITVGNGGDLS